MFLAKKLNKGAGTPAVLDAQFNYVTMLLHGDGTTAVQTTSPLPATAIQPKVLSRLMGLIGLTTLMGLVVI